MRKLDNLVTISSMFDGIHPLAIAQLQGIRAARFDKVAPVDCPWPVEEREATEAWFAGYSLAALVGSPSVDATVLHPVKGEKLQT